MKSLSSMIQEQVINCLSRNKLASYPVSDIIFYVRSALRLHPYYMKDSDLKSYIEEMAINNLIFKRQKDHYMFRPVEIYSIKPSNE